MTTPPADDIPPPPTLAGPGALALAGPARARPFSAAGRQAQARGTELHGPSEIRLDGWTVSTPEPAAAPASGAVVGPSSIRREVVLPPGSALETLLVPVELPAAALQWGRPPGSAAPLQVRLELRVSRAGAGGEGGGLAWAREAAGRVRVSAGGRSDVPTLLLAIHPAPARWTVEAEGAALRLSAELAGDPDRTLTLLLAAGAEGGQAARWLTRIAGLGVEEARVEQAAVDARLEGLGTRTGVPALDEGLEWAKARIRGSVVGGPGGRRIRRGGACPEAEDSGPADPLPPPASPRLEEAWLALGALAAGDPEPAEILLEGPIPTAYHLLAAARAAAWTGAAGGLLPHRVRIDAAVARLEGCAPHPAAAAALRELANAWETAGEFGRARAAAEAGRRAHVSTTRLPVLGAPSPGEASHAEVRIAEALFGPPPPVPWHPDAADPRGVERGLAAWGLCRAGNPERGYVLLRGHLVEGLDAGGMWEGSGGPRPCPDNAAAAAVAPAALLFGLLGGEAEAALGRLRLAPRLPGGWRAFEVRGIRVGDARVVLRYRRDAGAHVFDVEQESGRMPLMLVFEPEVPVAGALTAEVDGAPADLGQFRRGPRAGIRVQVPLDRPRTVRLIAAAADGRKTTPG